MISKGEAIGRLKKMGVTVADDQSIVTVLLPAEIPFSVGIKDIKEKLKAMDYDASFSIRRSKITDGEYGDKKAYISEEAKAEEENTQPEETVTEEELRDSLLSMDDDGQFSLGGLGLEF